LDQAEEMHHVKLDGVFLLLRRREVVQRSRRRSLSHTNRGLFTVGGGGVVFCLLFVFMFVAGVCRCAGMNSKNTKFHVWAFE
jgi:hypothetical protein